MTLSDQGVMSQEGTYPFPRDNVLGHERWHASDIAFKQEEPEDWLAPRGINLTTDDEYSRENLGLDDHLNMFGGEFGGAEFEALQRSWDRMPSQWTIDPKREGFAGQNNDVYIKDNQMRDALVQMYMNSENFKQLPEESRGPLALAMATALSSGEYDQNLGRDKVFSGGLFQPNPIMEPTNFTWHRGYDAGSPHTEYPDMTFGSEQVQIPFEETHYSYLNHPDERTARFIGGAIGKGYDPNWRYGTKDSDEQYPELKKALGNWWRSD